MKCDKVQVGQECRWKLTDVIGEEDGLGIECLSGSGAIARSAVCLSVCLSFFPSVCLSVSLSGWLAVWLLPLVLWLVHLPVLSMTVIGPDGAS